MAFLGCSFIFDGIPCEQYELMLYDIGEYAQSSGKFASGVSVIEEKLPKRWKPYFYGTKIDNTLEFTLVFGVNERRIDSGEHLDRYEMAEIAAWLTGHDGYRWLEIMQEDLINIRYKCIITSLEVVEENGVPWALSASVKCDSPYAYNYPAEYKYEIDGESEIFFYNESSHGFDYEPVIEFEIKSGNSFGIVNHMDADSVIQFSSLPSAIKTLRIDNDRRIVTTGDSGINPYPYFNFGFLKLKRGENHLTVNGNGILKIQCEFPVNVGG